MLWCCTSDFFVVILAESSKVYPKQLNTLAAIKGHPELRQLRQLIKKYLFNKYENHISNSRGSSGRAQPAVELDTSNDFSIFHSATAFFAYHGESIPIEQAMREAIRSNPSWRGKARRDAVLVRVSSCIKGFAGMRVARVMLLFSFTAKGERQDCALVQFFKRVGDSPDLKTRMWIVEPEYELESSTTCVGCCTGVNASGRCRYHHDCKAPKQSVIDVGDILRLAHLLGVPKGDECPPKSLTPEETLDFYDRFYVNRFADMHMHQTLYEARQ